MADDGEWTLHGLIDSLPLDGEWSESKRERWIAAMVGVLDYTMASRRSRYASLTPERERVAREAQ